MTDNYSARALVRRTVAARCPKCGSLSGDDWSQCGRVCPMPGSPVYFAEWTPDATYHPAALTANERQTMKEAGYDQL